MTLDEELQNLFWTKLVLQNKILLKLILKLSNLCLNTLSVK